MNKRTEILEEASRLIDDGGARAVAYGSAEDNFARIAAGWGVVLETPISSQQVALCMAWLKIARIVNGGTRDGYVDGAAYMALAGELDPDVV